MGYSGKICKFLGIEKLTGIEREILGQTYRMEEHFASCPCGRVTIRMEKLVPVPNKRHIGHFFRKVKIRATPLKKGSVSIKTIDDIATGTVEKNVTFVRCRNCGEQLFIVTREEATAVFPSSWLEHEPGPMHLSRSQSSVNLLPEEISSCFVVTDVRGSPDVIVPEFLQVSGDVDCQQSDSDYDDEIMFACGENLVIGRYVGSGPLTSIV